MKRTLLAFGLAMAIGATAQAQTPKEVLEPYKAYRAALAEKDRDLAADKAFEAWQAAEDVMGDTKTTGDLASNFAELRPRYLDNKQAWKQVMEAHKRSIDLSGLYDDDPQGVEIDRRTKYLSWLISNVSPKVRKAWHTDYGPEMLKSKITEFGLTGTTFDAESMAFSAQSAMMRKDWNEVERDSKKAIALFDARTDGLGSPYEYAVPVYLARAYDAQKKPVEAALTFQNLMTKLESRGGHDNGVSDESYAKWLRLRDEIIEAGIDTPEAKQVINFTIPSGRAAELAPVHRIPPMFPRSFLSGNKSGFVRVKFNIDSEGRIINPVITSSTNKRLHEATLKSLEGWRYTPNLPEVRSKDVETTIRFDLQGRKGKRFPYDEEKTR